MCVSVNRTKYTCGKYCGTTSDENLESKALCKVHPLHECSFFKLSPFLPWAVPTPRPYFQMWILCINITFLSKKDKRKETQKKLTSALPWTPPPPSLHLPESHPWVTRKLALMTHTHTGDQLNFSYVILTCLCLAREFPQAIHLVFLI